MTAEPGGVTTDPGGCALPLLGPLPTAPCHVDSPAASTSVTPSDASSTRPATAVHTRCGTAATSARARGMNSLSITEAPRGATSATPYGVYPKGYAAQPARHGGLTRIGPIPAKPDTTVTQRYCSNRYGVA